MKTNDRIVSFDFIRGIAMILMILFHSSIYHFANIHRIDFSNPPAIIILMSFMALWGGIFIIISMIVNTLMIARRNQISKTPNTFLYLTYACLFYLLLHFMLNVFFGTWALDFVNNQPDMTFFASLLRNRNLQLPGLKILFEGSSLSTIALNLLIISWTLYALLKVTGQKKATGVYVVLGMLGFAIMLFSYTRISLFNYYLQAQESKRFILSLFYGWLIANPYPLIPYLAYGFFGALVGLIIYNKKKKILRIVILPTGLLFLLYGIFGMMHYNKTISKPDFFWYFKTHFELGLFLIIIPGIYLLLENKRKFLDKVPVINWFSRISLTLFMLQTLFSEILRVIINPLVHTWNQTINGCLLFGFLNVLLWSTILYFWSKNNFKYSIEYFWVILFSKTGKASTKMAFEGKTHA